MQKSAMLKLEIYVPVTHFDALAQALLDASAGVVGNYDSVLSYSKVMGTWRPLPGADPYDGEIGILQQGEEYKVETTCSADILESVIAAIRAAHPYEEPVIHAIELV